MWIDFGCNWMFQLPLAWYLSQEIGPKGVYRAIGVGESVLAIVSVVLFRRGVWKKVEV